MTRLPAAFLKQPLAHRALHDVRNGLPENSLAAIRAAIAKGYGIEIDVQLTADGEAVVFHDDSLDRLTGEKGRVRLRTLTELRAIPLSGGDGECIPSFAEVLDLVSGAVPLLVEIKDQDGGMGPDVGPLEAAVARDLQGYDGPVAVMSFNPQSVAAFATASPDTPRGLTTSAFDVLDWNLTEETCDRLRAIPDAETLDVSFISHEAADLGRARVGALREKGCAILCWTIRSPEQEAEARKIAANITFEGYLADIPA